MILIAHRGNLNGQQVDLENSPGYIDQALNLGFDVEIDLWHEQGQLYLGHDNTQYPTEIGWLYARKNNLWVHCKNIEALLYMQTLRATFNYFWHDNDTVTLTSKGFIWAYPGKQPIFSSIAVMPEINNDDVGQCFGVCSDYPARYK